MRRNAFLSVGVVFIAGSLLLAGCSGGGGSGKAGPAATAPATAADVHPGYFGDNSGSGQPADGGSFTFTYTGAISSFDPATQQYAGTSGGDEAAAVYGTLAAFDTTKNAYGPSMADSITANSDYSVWTITLRDGVNFTDGTPYNADAVVFNMNRLIASKQGWSSTWNQMVKGVTAKDARTVEVTLTQSWADFPFLLSQAPGMIASPTAVKSEGANYLNAPVGAGPFILKKWTPGQSVVVTANAKYWGGKPHLDTVTFQTITGGDQAAADALARGDAQGAYSGLLPVALKWLDPAQGLNGYSRIANTSSVLLMNNGTKGNPNAGAKDLNVRLAIAQGIDTKVVDKRGNDGLGIPNTGLTIWDAPSKWQNSDPGVKYNLDAAKAALKKAKDAGFNGKVDLQYQQPSEAAALTIQAQLQQVGFTVTTSPQATVTDAVNHVLVAGDYDLELYGWPVPDEPGELFTSYLNRFGMQHNQTGFYSATLEQAFKDFAATSDGAKKKAALATVQAEFTKGVPAVPLSGGIGVAAWAKNVHGVTVSSRITLDLSKAWISK